MPASPRPRCLHLLGSNAHIYIAQECTTRGPRRLHLSCARAQSKTCVYQEDTRAPACMLQEARASFLRASKRCPQRPPHARVGKIRAPPPYACIQRCTHHLHIRVQDIRASSLFLHAPKMAAPTRTRAKNARVALCCPRRKDARVWAVTGAATDSPCLRSSSHVLPHD